MSRTAKSAVHCRTPRGAVRDRAAGAAVVVLSDYQKGAITHAVAQSAIAAARSANVPVLVDPKVPHVEYYAGASLVTPNHHEAEAVTLMRIRSADEARQAAYRFRDRVSCESVLITRGEHGMWLLAPDGEFDLRAEAREVSDVTGAGDTVIAAMAIGLAGGGSLQQAAHLANRAAGLAVSHFGPTAVSAEELRAALHGLDLTDCEAWLPASAGRQWRSRKSTGSFTQPSA